VQQAVHSQESFRRNRTAVTPHQSPSVTASPQGEAFGATRKLYTKFRFIELLPNTIVGRGLAPAGDFCVQKSHCRKAIIGIFPSEIPKMHTFSGGGTKAPPYGIPRTFPLTTAR